MLTEAQKQAMLIIQDKLARGGGVSPSIDELTKAFGKRSRTSTFKMLCALEERGFIRRLPQRARAIEVIRPVKRARCFTYDRAREEFRYVRTVYVA